MKKKSTGKYLKQSAHAPKKKFRFIILIMLLALLATGIYFFVRRNNYNVTIYNAADAISHAKKLGEEYGYENAMAELTERNTTSIDGGNYYRLQQNYQGIPVYGRTIVYATDINNCVSSITGNALDVDEDISLTPVVTADQIAESINSYLIEELNYSDVTNISISQLDSSNLCIYNMDGSKSSFLAYQLYLGGYEVIVSAIDGEILSFTQNIYADTVTCYSADGNSTFNGLLTQEGAYVLKDMDRNIYIYDANDKTYWDPDSNEVNTNVLRLVTSENAYFGDKDDNVKKPQIAFSFYRALAKVYDYYDNTFGETGCGVMVGICNDSSGAYNGSNAGGGYEVISQMLESIPYNENTLYPGRTGLVTIGTDYCNNIENNYDTLGHEYTHYISHFHIGWSDTDSETGAIDEALSDIFGEIIQATVGNGADWEHGDRIIHNPSINNYPEKANEKELTEDGWVIVKDSDGNNKTTNFSHGYSTVISHAAYLMWSGIDGNNAKKLDIKELEELWYRAMLMMPSDCNFTECRTLVELAASSMNLTYKQIQCVSEAFDAAGIYNAENIDIDYELAANCQLSVFGKNGELDSNYTITISGYGVTTSYADNAPLKLYGIENYNATTVVTNSEPFSLPSTEGIYAITIKDYNDTTNKFSFIARIRPQNSKDTLQIYTDFENPLVIKVTDATIDEDSTILPGFYKQIDNELNTLTIHEVNGNKVIFTIFWYRIWDITQIEASLNGNVASFDYTSSNNESLHAKGTIDFQDDTAILTLSECTQSYVDTGEYRFKLVGIKFSVEQLTVISYALGVPENLDTQITQGEPAYWEGGDMYRTSIEVYYNGACIAGASVNSLTGDLAGNIYLCQITTVNSESNLDMVSTFGFTKAWDIHDRSGTEHIVTSLAFQEEGTFCCAVGWYLSEWYIAFTGTYQPNGNEIVLHYTLDGQERIASYQVDWENKILRQTSEENLIIPHQVGSEYPFEENPWYTAADLANQVEVFIRYS